MFELAQDLGNKIYSYLSIQLESSGQNICIIQNMFQNANRTLYLIKSEYAKEMQDIIRKINDGVNEYLKKYGQKSRDKLSLDEYNKVISEYSKLMAKLDEKKIDNFTKFMIISHWKDNDTGLWVSRLEKKSGEYKSSIIDFVSTSTSTNNYFTYGKLRSTDIMVTTSSLSLLYWFEDECRINDFRTSFKAVIDSIFEVLEYDTKYEGVESDIDAFITILSDKSQKYGEAVFNHIKAMFIISFLEKILRLIYICINEDAFYKKSLITLGITLGKSQNSDNILENIIGYHHFKWIRYYFMTDEKDVGRDYRNRIAHLRDIRVGEITFQELIKIAWLVISTINSIFVNLVNDHEKKHCNSIVK